MGSQAHVVVGSLVWAEDPDEAWIDGEVVEISGDEITLNASSGKLVTAKLSSIYAKDPEAPTCGVDDMTRLAYLHEPGVLQNLRSRYQTNQIYTYTGNILIAVNPFRRLPHLYDNHMMQQYKGAAFGDLSPHPFAVADAAYRLMIKDEKSQAILVSGESGAGKTESTKRLMQYLAFMGGRAGAEVRTVEQKVLESNPVLEAFGNAKTVRNNNSSRFGKFVEIQFDDRGKISGAAVRTYLLEKSRVCQISDPERNYHCFYMLCAAPPEDIERYKLADARTFHYLNQSDCINLDALDDAKEYLDTRRAMDVVGINNEEQDAIFRVVAAILHLGNVEFSDGEENDSSVLRDEKSRFHLNTAAELFMCDANELESSLCKRVIVTRGEKITKNLDPRAAALSRDGLAKTVYSRLFDWLVNRINDSIGQDPNSKFLIGVLDIYGFECFKTNSFEQFCINLTNEKLQQHFNQHVFKMEQEEYTKEEIDWSYIEFIDNQEILDLIEKKPGGIIALLDETCMLPRANHETFAEKLYQNFTKNPHFSKPKLSRSDFTIHHYAGDVIYQTDLFLDKNKDFVVPEHQALLGASNCSFIASLFPPEDTSKPSKFSSIGTRFKQQLQSLLETLSATEPHYIRCIKPNNLLKPAIFENKNVIQQLRCGGVLEAIRISCAGFPTRRAFDEFIDRFGVLAPEVLGGSYDEITAAKKLLEKVQLKGYQIGLTKVFLRAGQMAELDAMRNEVLGRSASKIQRKVRTHQARKNFILVCSSAVHLQAICRGTNARRSYENMRREAASLTLQTYIRRHHAIKAYQESLSASITIQSALRAMAARKELLFRQRNKAAVLIQSCFRTHLARSDYISLKKAAIATQCAWRVRIAKKELRKLKLAAKETGALQAAKNKLEKQVEDLTLRLQLERRMRSDAEEAKSQEIAKLKLAYQEMEKQVKETKELLAEEKVASKIASEKEALVKEVPVVDTALVDTLTAENENLKTVVTSLETKIQETEKKYEDSAKEAKEAESLIAELKNSVLSLREKLSQMEAENQLLRKQALSSPPSRQTSQISTKLLPPLKQSLSTVSNGRPHTEEHQSASPMKQGTSPMKQGTPLKKSTSYLERQPESLEALVNCVVQRVGVVPGKPIFAITIYKCLLRWKSFEADKTSVFDRVIQMTSSAFENPDNNDDLAFWLGNSSTLAILLQKSLKISTGSGSTPRKRLPPSTSFFGRMTQGFRASSASMSYEGSIVVRPVEAKQTAMLFKQQLQAFVETFYGMVRDNLKKELTSLLSLAIQAPRTAKASIVRGRSVKNSNLDSHWKTLVDNLNDFLEMLQENGVPTIIIRKLLGQTFAFVNVQLFNSLLMRRECCSFSNGEYVKYGLEELEGWCNKLKEEIIGSAWNELKHIKQAVGFLVIFKKFNISYEDLTSDLCPALNVQQLYRICTQYWDDKYNTQSVSPDVLSRMTDETSDDTSSGDFLLDDDNNIPFTWDEISTGMEDKEFSQIIIPNEILEIPALQFLQDSA
ncbi:Myosin [Rhynchospora pubera]|uniref:Myosin n=2 Tax=Rhynchospora pubera TaxID=906938 RepID=A0AAV8GIY1_9POAL|nr:Myosin [Rhynchospora pubera]KAJ4805894.1 Myosin [Rhynchospora pubera]